MITSVKERILEQGLATIHGQQVQSAIDSIKCNLTEKTVHILRPFVMQMMQSPELLASLPPNEMDKLYEVWDAISGEIRFRQEERRA